MVNTTYNLGCNDPKIDDNYVKMLELMDKVIESKFQLEDLMKNGFFMLGKSRYIMGTSAISKTQIPSEDCDMESMFDLKVLDESLHSTQYKSFNIHASKMQSKSIETVKSESSVRSRTAGASRVEECEKEQGCTPRRDDPIKWFSALPPQSLRQSQQYFKEATLKIAQIATLQSKLDALRLGNQHLRSKTNA